MKELLKLYPILVKLLRLTPFSPPRQINLRKERRMERERIRPINLRAKHKLTYPCLICDEDHYTKDCLRWFEVSHLLKGSSGTPVMLKEPFPLRQIQIVVDLSQLSSPFGSQIFIAGMIPIHITTRSKEYPSPVGKKIEVPSSTPSSSSGLLYIMRPSTEVVI